MSIKYFALAAVCLGVASVNAAGQLTDDAIKSATPAVSPMPSDAAIALEMIGKKDLLKEALNVQPAQGLKIPDVSSGPISLNVKAPAGGSPITNILDAAARMQPDAPGMNVFDKPASDTEEFVVFLSTSIPADVLRPLLTQAADAKATVVFRGTPSGDLNFKSLQDHLLALNPKKMPQVDINPVLFTKYAVERVPAFAVGKYGATPGLDANGCLPPDVFAKITGDISVVYALKELSKGAPKQLRSIAERHLF